VSLEPSAARSHLVAPARRAVVAVLLGGVLAAIVAAPGAFAVSAPRADRAPASTQLDVPTGVVEGIDVSHWQNTIDWLRVAAAGKKFAIIKASESTDYVDPLYATNRSSAQANGIWTGAYHFARPDATTGDALREADHFADTLLLGPGDLIPALDLEVSGGLSIAALQTWVTTFLGEVTTRTGVRPMIYTSPAFWKKYMGDSQALADAGYKTLWVAHWNVTTPWVPANNWGGRGWTFWQYSNCGTVSGISGCVDLDRYNGTDLMPVAYSAFNLTATSAGQVKQGRTGSATIGIARINFDAAVALDVSGLPAGTTAAWDASPTSDTSSALAVSTDAAVTPIGSYPLTITGVGDGLTRTTSLTLVVADGIPPTVVAPVTRLWTGTLGSTVPILVSWGASDPSGISATALQRSVNGGSWSWVHVSGPTVRSVLESTPLGATVRNRARATDRLANVSTWATGPAVRPLLTQQTSTAIRYSGTWRSLATSSASGGSIRYSTSRGASASFTFTGVSVAWVAARGPSRGSARVYLDGAYAGTVSLYASSGHSRAIVFAKTFGVNGSHTLRIVVLGTSGHPRVDVDGFVRLSMS